MDRSRVLVRLSLILPLAWLPAAQAPAQEGELPRPAAASGAPEVVSYQGQVKVSGEPYTGTGTFKFALVSLGGVTTYWTNDGTASGEPAQAVSLQVRDGLFDVLLGDTTLAHMSALPASIFAGTERYLRMWFSTDGSTFTLLSPDLRLAAAPYAQQAQEASNTDRLDGQHASAFAGTTHTHWGQSWTGSGIGLALSGGTDGIWGSGSTRGVSGASSASGGHGVEGVASATSGN
ncbi:MAG TPA: hypothetical protein PLS53_15290, partial [Thermoanaerobaculaceae bacterium]|nr:hypothetical protein [Thermoanaerobaculaceae bacterium]